MPKVSVIIATYNHARYIKEAVESVLGQTFKDVEIVIVDNGSTDGTKDVLRDYISSGKVRYIYHPHRGGAAARNIGLKAAAGKYIKFLDSDDILFPRQIELQTLDMEQSSKTFSITDFEIAFENGVRKQKEVCFERRTPLSRFLENSPAPIHAFLIQYDALLAVGGFDEQLLACQDTDLWLRLLIAGATFSLVRYVGCCYRIFRGSLSSSEERVFTQKVRIFEKLDPVFFERWSELADDVRKQVLWQNVRLIHKGFARGFSWREHSEILLDMVRRMYSVQGTGLQRFLVWFLGINRYLKVQYAFYRVYDPRYPAKLLAGDVAWREEAAR